MSLCTTFTLDILQALCSAVSPSCRSKTVLLQNSWFFNGSATKQCMISCALLCKCIVQLLCFTIFSENSGMLQKLNYFISQVKTKQISTQKEHCSTTCFVMVYILKWCSAVWWRQHCSNIAYQKNTIFTAQVVVKVLVPTFGYKLELERGINLKSANLFSFE